MKDPKLSGTCSSDSKMHLGDEAKLLPGMGLRYQKNIPGNWSTCFSFHPIQLYHFSNNPQATLLKHRTGRPWYFIKFPSNLAIANQYNEHAWQFIKKYEEHKYAT